MTLIGQIHAAQNIQLLYPRKSAESVSSAFHFLLPVPANDPLQRVQAAP
jgi:hypothetical protein